MGKLRVKMRDGYYQGPRIEEPVRVARVPRLSNAEGKYAVMSMDVDGDPDSYASYVDAQILRDMKREQESRDRQTIRGIVTPQGLEIRGIGLRAIELANQLRNNEIRASVEPEFRQKTRIIRKFVVI